MKEGENIGAVMVSGGAAGTVADILLHGYSSYLTQNGYPKNKTSRTTNL